MTSFGKQVFSSLDKGDCEEAQSIHALIVLSTPGSQKEGLGRYSTINDVFVLRIHFLENGSNGVWSPLAPGVTHHICCRKKKHTFLLKRDHMWLALVSIKRPKPADGKSYHIQQGLLIQDQCVWGCS